MGWFTICWCTVNRMHITVDTIQLKPERCSHFRFSSFSRSRSARAGLPPLGPKLSDRGIAKLQKYFRAGPMRCSRLVRMPVTPLPEQLDPPNASTTPPYSTVFYTIPHCSKLLFPILPHSNPFQYRLEQISSPIT